MPRVAIYARYSSDQQRDASIEDQVRLCREFVVKQGEDWKIEQVYTDHAISGASLMRPGIQQLIQNGLARKFDVIVCEALDRLSRDQEDIAGIYKRMQFANVRMLTLSEGEISSLHIGLKGTMNALFLKDLADKVRRGLRGRVEKGRSGGGNSYGYDVVRRVGEDGEYAKGERTINECEAAVVRRIFSDYIRGISPKAIATALNKEGVKAPAGKLWGASTLYGNRDRGTGILNNELYIGQLVWNRLRYVKDPETGRRISRKNADSDVIRQDVPELRIIDQETWDQVRVIQGVYNKRETPLWTKNRPRHLLSKLTKCGCCGAGFTGMTGDTLGCSASREKGSCTNRLLIKREKLEGMVLSALRDHLMDEALCEEFCKAYTARINECRMEHNASLAGYRAEYAKLERERQQIIKSILDGVSGLLLKDRANAVQARREELEKLIENTKEAPVLFHPNMASRYHNEVRNLIASLGDAEAKAEAGQILRSLIEMIVLTPDESGNALTVDLVGDLAGILSIATNHGRPVIDDELLKLQPVNEMDASDETIQHTVNGRFPPLEAMVAGDRTRRLDSFGAMVAGGRFGRRASGSGMTSEVVVAGIRFELMTFRL